MTEHPASPDESDIASPDDSDTASPDDSDTASPDGSDDNRAPVLLDAVAAEIELFVGSAGWDRAPVLFALVATRELASDPAAAAMLGTAAAPADIADTSITPIAQEELPEGPLDEALGQIGWPDEVLGCALSQEIVMLPPTAEAALPDDVSAEDAARHPDRREARLVVAVLRDGTSAAVLRLRAVDDELPADLLTGPDLAPNLVQALLATLRD